MGRRGRFVYGFGLTIAVAIVFHVLNVERYRFALAPCDDCMLDYGVPFTWLSIGGFVTMSVVDWQWFVANVVAILGVAAFAGLASVYLLEPKHRA